MTTRESKRKKSQRNRQTRMLTRWQHSEEVSPAFGRLMTLLLKRKSHSNNKALLEDNGQTDGQHRL
jgi:hypothetical protein